MKTEKLNAIEENWRHVKEFEKMLNKNYGIDNGKIGMGGFSLGGFPVLNMPFTYHAKTNTGRLRKSTNQTPLRCMFCPFSGLPLYEESKERMGL